MTYLEAIRAIATLADERGPLSPVDADLDREAGMSGNLARLLQAARDLDNASAPFGWIVRLVSANDGNINIGPFAAEADADAWLENMPQDDDLTDAVVEAMAPAVLPNGEPNY